MRNLVIFPLLLLVLASCSRRQYQTAAYSELSTQHQLLAVLPVTTTTTGRIPAKWTEEELRQVETIESEAFQIAIYEEIARRGGVYYENIRVNFQHIRETNALLKEAGIEPRDSWDMPATKLADALGVDAVIRVDVTKQRYLTDLEGLAVGVATTLLGLIDDNPIFLGQASRTSDVWASASVVDGQSGVSVWTTRQKCPTFWNRQHQDIVRTIARTLGRRFPYRNGERR